MSGGESASVVLAAVAAVAALFGAVYARRAALAAERVLTVERQRRHEELGPYITVELVDDHRVEFRNQGPADYDRVDYRVLAATPGLLADGVQTDVVSSLGKMAVAEARLLPLLHRHRGPVGGQVDVLVSSYRGDDVWQQVATVLVDTPVNGPSEVSVSIPDA